MTILILPALALLLAPWLPRFRHVSSAVARLAEARR